MVFKGGAICFLVRRERTRNQPNKMKITPQSEDFTNFTAFLFSGMSPRFDRPTFAPGWEGPQPKGFRGSVIMTNAASGRFLVAVEAYKASSVSAGRVWQGHQGFVATSPIGESVTWTTRHGKKMVATQDGVSEVITQPA